MLFFIGFNSVPDQDQNLTVCGPALLVSHDMQLVQHFLLDSDGETGDGHNNTSN